MGSYRHELLIVVALLFAIGSYLYKEHRITLQDSTQSEAMLQEIKESVELQALWGDKRLTKKVDEMRLGLSPAKVKWSRKGKRLQATFKTLSARELNGVMKQVMNLAIEIEKLELLKSGETYSLELKCKW
jgi:hypothetical protein